jgi:hypothetical protein
VGFRGIGSPAQAPATRRKETAKKKAAFFIHSPFGFTNHPGARVQGAGRPIGQQKN